ncbi:MAG TPA: amidohydrolase [Pyrinomonadaceae bacterium]|nr:amidohydrolase [Pyrinomonadaceae bacterium]
MNKFRSFVAFILLSFLTNSTFAIIPANRPAVDVDLLIVGATIVTMNAERQVIENGAIAITNGKIDLMGTRNIVVRNSRPKRTIDATGKVIIPGLINTHTHIPMVLFRGISDDLDLNDWLTKFIFPAEAKNVDEQFVRAGTRLGLAEMIRGGTTTYADMYYFEDAIADETKKAGVRGVLGETIIDFPVADNKTHAEAMAYTERYIKKWQGDPLITPAAAPHAPYTVSKDHLKAVKALSDKHKAPVLIHVAETKKERDDAEKNFGMTPVKYLDSFGFLNERTIAAHSVWLSPEELRTYKDRGVGSAHCPQSNLKLASGVAAIPYFLREDIAVGLGTDGAASNNDLNMWEEIDTAAKLHKQWTLDPKTLPAEQAFAMATIGGARALKMGDKIGSIEAGKQADLVILDMDGLHQTPWFNVYSALVYTTKASDVRTVIINGRVVMQDRRLLTLNENAIKIDARRYRDKIVKSLQ